MHSSPLWWDRRHTNSRSTLQKSTIDSTCPGSEEAFSYEVYCLSSSSVPLGLSSSCGFPSRNTTSTVPTFCLNAVKWFSVVLFSKQNKTSKSSVKQEVQFPPFQSWQFQNWRWGWCNHWKWKYQQQGWGSQWAEQQTIHWDPHQSYRIEWERGREYVGSKAWITTTTIQTKKVLTGSRRLRTTELVY